MDELTNFSRACFEGLPSPGEISELREVINYIRFKGIGQTLMADNFAVDFRFVK